MPGDRWQQFANLRLLQCLQMTMPGKKLNFMGNEFAQSREWNVNQSLDWHLLQDNHPEHLFHRGIQALQRDLNQHYLNEHALHQLDFDGHGFQWIDCQDAAQSILSYIRRGKDNSFVIIVLNFTPVPRYDYRLGVPMAGRYQEILNSDANCYSGSNLGNHGGRDSENIAWMGFSQSINIHIPPLAGLILKVDADAH